MNDELNEYLEKLSEIRNGLDDSVREARELLQDLKTEKKYWEDEKRIPLFKEVEKNLELEVAKSIADIEPDLKEFIKKAEDRIAKRITDLVDMLLLKKKNDVYSVEDLVVARSMIDTLLSEKGIKPVSLREYQRNGNKLPPGLRGK